MKGKRPLRPNVNNESEETSTNSNGKENDNQSKKLIESSISNPFSNSKKTENLVQKEDTKNVFTSKENNFQNTVNQKKLENVNDRKNSFKENKDTDHEIEKVIKKKGNEYTFSETSQSHSKFFFSFK